MNWGRPFSSVVKGEPMFLCLIGRQRRRLTATEYIRAGTNSELKVRIRKHRAAEVTEIICPWTSVDPHQLSSAVKAPPAMNRVSPFKGFGTLLPTNLEKLPMRCCRE